MRWCRAPALVTLLVAAFPGAADQAPLDAGRRALEERRFRDAVADLKRAVERSPTVEAYYLLGRAYWDENRPYSISSEQAIAAFEHALALDPGLASPWGVPALEQLGVAAVRNERLDVARRGFVRLRDRETDPDRKMQFVKEIAEIDLDRGEFKPPPDALFNSRGEVVLPMGLGNMETNRNFEKGRHTSNPAREEEHYRRAVETDPAMYQAYLNLGVALSEQGRWTEAIPSLEEADRVWRRVKGNTPYNRAIRALLKCHIELGSLDKAVEDWTILAGTPVHDDWEVLYGLQLKIALGRAAETIPVLEQGARRDPDNPDVLETLATAYAATRRYAEAARTMKAALDAIPPGQMYLQHRLRPWKALLAQWEAQARATATGK